MKALNTRALQEQLETVAELATKDWFETYLKGVIAYRGVKSPVVRALTKAWLASERFAAQSLTAQQRALRSLMSSQYAEDKFAAIFAVQLEWLDQLKPLSILREVDAWFEEELIFDWSTCDWLTVRVLEPLVTKDGSARQEVYQWHCKSGMWQRRASIVAFRGLARQGRGVTEITKLVEALVVESERFIQTGIGWTVADLARANPDTAASLVETHFDLLSREVIDRHTKHLARHSEYKKRVRMRP